MDGVTANVVSVTVARGGFTAAEVPELRELFGLERLPLAPARVSIELDGVPTAVVNALRRTVTDEMIGHALQAVPDGDTGGLSGASPLTTDLFMLPQFVNARIAQIRLRPQIPADVVANLRLKLDVTNTGATPLVVYAGDFEVAAGAMPEPLFNPTTEIAVIQPGARIVVPVVRISAGYGRDDGVYQRACRAAHTHLDLAQHSDAEMREESGVAADESGYKVSSLLANPRRHRLTATLPATGDDPAESRAVFADACANIKERLRLVATAVERRAEPPSGGFAHRGVQYTVVELEGGLFEGILRVPGETHTIGELLRRTVYELTPDIANVAYLIISHENCLSLSVRHTEDVTAILMGAVRHAIATFDVIQRGISAAR
jgi:DNA-directed RNA polymerase subunit L